MEKPNLVSPPAATRKEHSGDSK